MILYQVQKYAITYQHNYEGCNNNNNTKGGGGGSETDRQSERERGAETEKQRQREYVSNLVFYAQSTSTIISGRRERERGGGERWGSKNRIVLLERVMHPTGCL